MYTVMAALTAIPVWPSGDFQVPSPIKGINKPLFNVMLK